MTRTAIRRTLSAIAALALVSVVAGGPASAGELQNTERELVDSLQTMHRTLDKPTFGEKFMMGLKKDHKATSIISGFNSLER